MESFNVNQEGHSTTHRTTSGSRSSSLSDRNSVGHRIGNDIPVDNSNLSDGESQDMGTLTSLPTETQSPNPDALPLNDDTSGSENANHESTTTGSTNTGIHHPENTNPSSSAASLVPATSIQPNLVQLTTPLLTAPELSAQQKAAVSSSSNASNVPANSYFFKDHTRRLAVAHFKRLMRPAELIAAPSTVLVSAVTESAAINTQGAPSTPRLVSSIPLFVIQIYLRYERSMFTGVQDLDTIMGWRHRILELSAIKYLLEQMGLHENNIRIEMYDSLATDEGIIEHNRAELEHRDLVSEFTLRTNQVMTASNAVKAGDLTAHPNRNPKVHEIDARLHELSGQLKKMEARTPVVPAPEMPYTASPIAAPVARTQDSTPPPPPPPPPQVPPPDRACTRCKIAKRKCEGGPPCNRCSRLAFECVFPNAVAPSSSTAPPLAAPPAAPVADAGRRPITPTPGSSLNPAVRSVMQIRPASFFRGTTQPYHHMVLVIDSHDWETKGVEVLKFDREKDWTVAEDVVGEMDLGDFVLERVGVKEEKEERDGKRWLGEVLVEVMKGTVNASEKEAVAVGDLAGSSDLLGAEYFALLGHPASI